MLWISGGVGIGCGGADLCSYCVEDLLCTSISFRILCLVNERNGVREKRCDRVSSLCIKCPCCRRMSDLWQIEW